MQRATIEPITALGSTRRGVRTNVAPRRKGALFFGEVGPLGGWSGARGQGWAFGGGLNVLRGGFGVTPGNKQKHKQVESLQKVGVDEAHAPTEVSALPRVHLHLDPIFVGSHNSILGARRSP
jgi:hypothetical protein